VKATGGGRGMAVIRAHMNYIDREGNGLIDQDGERHQGREARREIARQWAREGTPIPEWSDRREAFNIMWSMPVGTDSKKLLGAVQALAARQFADHKYVMALHAHQANPHVHPVGDAAGCTKPPFGSKELPFGRRGYQRFGGRREV